MKKNIRLRLTFSFLIYSIVPLLIAGGLIALYSYSFQLDQAIEHQGHRAEVVAIRTTAFLEALEMQSHLALKLDYFPTMSNEEITQKLRLLQAGEDAFVELSLLSANGEERVRVANNDVRLESDLRDFSQDEIFLTPLQTGETYYGMVHFHSETGEPFMNIAIPIQNVRTGLVDGVLSAEVRIRAIWDMIAEMNVSPDNNFYLVGRTGEMIAHRNPSIVLRGTTIALPEDDGITTDLDGSRVVRGRAKVILGESAWTAVSESPLSYALNLTIRLVLGVALLMLIALLTSAYLGFSIVRQIIRPIEKFSLAAQQISAGNFSQRVDIHGEDEIASLGVSFNKMATELLGLFGSLEEKVAERTQALKASQLAALQVNDALRASEARLQAIMDHSPALISIKDLDGNIILANRKLADFDIPALDDYTGQNLYDLFHFDTAEVLWHNALAALQAGEVVQAEERILHRDSSEHIYLTTNFPLFLEPDQPFGVGGISTDITDRKKMEQRIAATLAFNQKLISSSPLGISVYDATGQCITANEAASTIVGATLEQILQQNIYHIQSWKKSGLLETAKAALQTGSDTRQEVHTASSFDQQVWLDCRFIPFDQEDNRQLMLIMDDISDRKQAAQKLAEKAQELSRSNAELEQFAYVASHDLQEPLRMVSSYLQLIERRYTDKLDEAGLEFIAFAVDGAARMKQLINDLLAFSRVGTRGAPLKKTHLDDVLGKVHINLQPLLEEHRGIILVEELPIVYADENQMTQLFQNMIGNALKFHDSTPPRIEIGAERKADHWQIHIRDNGIGIDPQYQERIFAIFERLHTAQEYKGTGIGLAICKRIVERHNGRIWVESNLGEGATFYFTLPILQETE
ncbi:MAG: PAS domain S-box protein [Chloroflexi bacterium]|nr:PAS domain S-box protein [Chloroflexota bacterium]